MDTHNAPRVSADVFITLVLALLSASTILTAGVDMRSLDACSNPQALYVCVCVLETRFPIPYSDNFLCVKKNVSRLNKTWDEKWQEKEAEQAWRRGDDSEEEGEERGAAESGYEGG